jgi:hypothetical protein
MSAYAVESPSHWHYVTYGLSELYGKESDDPETSGWGFELTFRLARHGEAEPPMWVLNLLNNLARYVFNTRNVFGVGHHLNLNGTIAAEADTEIRAIAFALDPELGRISTPHGSLEFLQIVGLTLDELEAVEIWNTEPFLELLATSNPLLLTDLQGVSRLRDPEIARRVKEGTARDGSSQYLTFASRVEWVAGEAATVTLGAVPVRALVRLLPHRLPYGRDFAVVGSSQHIRFEPAETPFWRTTPEELVIGLSSSAVAELSASLEAKRGTYRWTFLPNFELVVLPSEIKDKDGNAVETIG